MHALHPFFHPRSIAIVGASSDPERIGGRPLRFLIEAGFAGAIYPVNIAGHAELQGRRESIKGRIGGAGAVLAIKGGGDATAELERVLGEFLASFGVPVAAAGKIRIEAEIGV